MKIYDCFIYNNEELILDLRPEFSKNFVEKFIIVESKETHKKLKKNIFLIVKNLKILITKLNMYL